MQGRIVRRRPEQGRQQPDQADAEQQGQAEGAQRGRGRQAQQAEREPRACRTHTDRKPRAGVAAVLDQDVLDELLEVIGEDTARIIGVFLEDTPPLIRQLPAADSQIEIELAGGRRVRLSGPVDVQALMRVIAVLEGR